MEPAQLIPGSQVVKLGTLNRFGVGRHEHEEQQSQRQEECGCDDFLSPDHARCSLVCPRAFEGSRVVTLLTLLPEASLVHIVTRMTGTADHRGLDYVLRADMAISATRLCVRAQQREAGVGCMVEIPHLPA